MIFAYADPPYIGNGRRLYGKLHPEAEKWDDPNTHKQLVESLSQDFPDGWAISLSIKTLQQYLSWCPDDVKVLAWIKPNTAPPMGDGRMYTWEPVILRGGRKPKPATAMHVVANVEQYTFRQKPENYHVGAKPLAFSTWLFRCAGLTPNDELLDLFPGSGAVTKAWDSWRASIVDEPISEGLFA